MVGVHGHPWRELGLAPSGSATILGAKHFAEVEELRAEQRNGSSHQPRPRKCEKEPGWHPRGTHGNWVGQPSGDPIQQSNNPLIQRKPKNQQPKMISVCSANSDELTASAKEIGSQGR